MYTSNILKVLCKVTSGIGNYLTEMIFFTQNFNKENSTLCLYICNVYVLVGLPMQEGGLDRYVPFKLQVTFGEPYSR